MYNHIITQNVFHLQELELGDDDDDDDDVMMALQTNHQSHH